MNIKSIEIGLPAGFHIEREDRGVLVEFHIYEDGGPTWVTGAPRPLVSVQYWRPDDVGRDKEPRVSWPSTSDKRPDLAFALAIALALAADEAQR